MRKLRLSMCRGFMSGLVLFSIASMCHAEQGYITVLTSSASAQGFPASVVASLENQYQTFTVKNPFVTDTWRMTLFGPNPAYLAPPPPPSTLEEALSLGATVYVYGFANGMTYQNKQAINMAVYMAELCGSATNFNLIQTSTATFDRWTCEDVLNNLLDCFYKVDLSTPTPLPPEP